jgi:hypothetical protein
MTCATVGDVSAVTVGQAPRFGSYPYRALNGEHPRELWKDELYHSCGKGSHDFQFFGESYTEHLKIISSRH